MSLTFHRSLALTLLTCMGLFAQDGAVADTQSGRLTLQDALRRAAQYSPQLQSANLSALIAREDTKQARAAALPSLNGFNQFIYTQGNGTPSGVFVANDGVHVYNEQLVAHEELLALLRRGEVHAALAAQAVAQAKAGIAARGLNALVIQNFYAIASAERKLANSEASLTEAQRFVTVTEQQERGGEVAHADVIKAQLQAAQRERDLREARLAVDKAKLALSVLVFPVAQVRYGIAADLAEPDTPSMPSAVPIAAAVRASPDFVATEAALRQAKLALTVARYQYLPSLGLDVFYGIDANQFAARTDYPTQATGRSTLPDYLVPFRQNLGYAAQATLNIPIWNWGTTHSKVKQASLRAQQAQQDLNAAEKQVNADLLTAQSEAETARSELASLRSSSELSAESLRLTLLRYQAGEATALEVVDAQTTLTLARTAYDDGLVRYRIAAAILDNLSGNLK